MCRGNQKILVNQDELFYPCLFYVQGQPTDFSKPGWTVLSLSVLCAEATKKILVNKNKLF